MKISKKFTTLAFVGASMLMGHMGLNKIAPDLEIEGSDSVKVAYGIKRSPNEFSIEVVAQNGSSIQAVVSQHGIPLPIEKNKDFFQSFYSDLTQEGQETLLTVLKETAHTKCQAAAGMGGQNRDGMQDNCTVDSMMYTSEANSLFDGDGVVTVKDSGDTVYCVKLKDSNEFRHPDYFEMVKEHTPERYEKHYKADYEAYEAAGLKGKIVQGDTTSCVKPSPTLKL